MAGRVLRQTSQAPPAAPAAEPVRRSRRATPAAAAPEPAVATPVAQPAAQTAALAAPLPGFLSILQPKKAGPSALSLLVDGRTAAGEPNIFPTVYLTGGEGGGQMTAHDMNPEGSDADLPLGVDPLPCILLGVRFELIVWPKGYERGVKLSPRAKAIIAYDEAEAVDALQKAVQRYTFRHRPTQSQYDAVGHPTMNLEMLVYDPQAGLFCLQTSGTYDSAFNTGKELLVAFPIVTPTPVMIQPITYLTAGSKTQKPWPEHYYKVAQDSNSEAMKPVKAGFNTFIQENGSDPELAKAISAWSKHTLTDDMLEDLRQIATL